METQRHGRSASRAWSRVAVAVLGALAVTPAAWAQGKAEGASAGGLEEIVVSARKRDEALLEVPISVTAFSAEQIE